MKKVINNPVMVESKKVKGINNVREDQNEIRTFIILVVVISLTAVTIYGFTKHFKKEEEKTPVKTNGQINYERISIGTLLNRNYNEYYVMIYNSNNFESIIYSTLMSQYTSSGENHQKLFFCDLANSFNSIYYNVNSDNISNPKAKSIDELDLGDLTLIKVKNGKIEKYIEDYSEIVNLLK